MTKTGLITVSKENLRLSIPLEYSEHVCFTIAIQHRNWRNENIAQPPQPVALWSMSAPQPLQIHSTRLYQIPNICFRGYSKGYPFCRGTLRVPVLWSIKFHWKSKAFFRAKEPAVDSHVVHGRDQRRLTIDIWHPPNETSANIEVPHRKLQVEWRPPWLQDAAGLQHLSFHVTILVSIYYQTARPLWMVFFLMFFVQWFLIYWALEVSSSLPLPWPAPWRADGSLLASVALLPETRPHSICPHVENPKKSKYLLYH